MSDDFLNDLFSTAGDDLVDKKRTVYKRAPFVMPGSKRRSLPEIMPHIRKYALPGSRWVDHCGGTGVVSWNAPPCKVMVYNDRYSGVVCFYRAIRDYPAELEAELKRFPPTSREQWLISKDTWNEETDIVKRAAAWFYFVRLSVIGKGQAFGRGIASTFSPLPAALKVFGDIHDVIKNNNFILENLDLRLCATDYDHEETVHYFDVPYLKTDSGCYNHKFKEADMLETLNLISTLKGTVLFSHYPNELVEAQPFWTECHEWRVVLTSEVQAFTEENYRADKQSGMGHAIEKLWIKEHV